MTDSQQMLERIRAEAKEIAGLLPRLESDLEKAREAKNKADVIRRHVLRNLDKFSPHERENVFERSQREGEKCVRLETIGEASRERLELLEAIEPLLAAPVPAEPPPGSSSVPETTQIQITSVAEIHEAVDGERARIARELNDGPAQVLSNLLLEAEILGRLLRRDPALVVAELDEFKNAVRSAVADMRRVMFDLRPLALDDRGLIPASRMLAGDYQERTGITCQFILEGDERRLPAPIEESLYRIIQEALVNVSRHAKAKRAQVAITLLSDRVKVQVGDDGHGFDPAAEAKDDGRRKLGLRGMRERAAAVGGQLEVRSEIGKGCELTVEVGL